MDPTLSKIFDAAYEAMLGEGGDGDVLIIVQNADDFPWNEGKNKNICTSIFSRFSNYIRRLS